MFTAALLIIPRSGNNPSTHQMEDEWKKQDKTVGDPYDGILFSSKKGQMSATHQVMMTWMNLTDIMLSKRCQA